MLTRRNGLMALGASFTQISGLFSSSAFAQDNPFAKFDSLYASLERNPELVDSAHAYRELNERLLGPSAERFSLQPHHSRKFSSSKRISTRAEQMLVYFEVTSQSRYERMFRRPTLPGGNSGITIGIGYDLGYVHPGQFDEDWSGLLKTADLAKLRVACGHIRQAAENILPSCQAVSIEWAAAMSQFQKAVPSVAGETEYAFPRSSELSSNSFGALVSLIYNRGGSMQGPPGDKLDCRAEMRVIKDYIIAGEFEKVPDQIRHMERIWRHNKKTAGLLIRREMEAQLFEAGLVVPDAG